MESSSSGSSLDVVVIIIIGVVAGGIVISFTIYAGCTLWSKHERHKRYLRHVDVKEKQKEKTLKELQSMEEENGSRRGNGSANSREGDERIAIGGPESLSKVDAAEGPNDEAERRSSAGMRQLLMKKSVSFASDFDEEVGERDHPRSEVSFTSQFYSNQNQQLGHYFPSRVTPLQPALKKPAPENKPSEDEEMRPTESENSYDPREDQDDEDGRKGYRQKQETKSNSRITSLPFDSMENIRDESSAELLSAIPGHSVIGASKVLLSPSSSRSQSSSMKALNVPGAVQEDVPRGEDGKRLKKDDANGKKKDEEKKPVDWLQVAMESQRRQLEIQNVNPDGHTPFLPAEFEGFRCRVADDYPSDTGDLERILELSKKCQSREDLEWEEALANSKKQITQDELEKQNMIAVLEASKTCTHIEDDLDEIVKASLLEEQMRIKRAAEAEALENQELQFALLRSQSRFDDGAIEAQALEDQARQFAMFQSQATSYHNTSGSQDQSSSRRGSFTRQDSTQTASSSSSGLVQAAAAAAGSSEMLQYPSQVRGALRRQDSNSSGDQGQASSSSEYAAHAAASSTLMGVGDISNQSSPPPTSMGKRTPQRQDSNVSNLEEPASSSSGRVHVGPGGSSTRAGGGDVTPPPGRGRGMPRRQNSNPISNSSGDVSAGVTLTPPASMGKRTPIRQNSGGMLDQVDSSSSGGPLRPASPTISERTPPRVYEAGNTSEDFTGRSLAFLGKHTPRVEDSDIDDDDD